MKLQLKLDNLTQTQRDLIYKTLAIYGYAAQVKNARWEYRKRRAW